MAGPAVPAPGTSVGPAGCLPARGLGPTQQLGHRVVEPAATVTATGVSAAATFIGVLTVREGRISCWREYQNPLAIAGALRAAAP